ncbi:hypothetical protein SAMN05660653_01137 [Desulfonatronum thiosulfatophilum]|uniref:Uncharacterized protein n=1 Tax=Desulfonatronum thiosulfatophilum TaxID=617002 RepID=A0A1G6BRF5_9BACT|nr:hypothetical protein [Desulfonatronum thiosulfatophilum]SDB23188.1 hypothetical protein SAMN05660653_01137 [Desulfonatronum thiosulfatophilum]
MSDVKMTEPIKQAVSWIDTERRESAKSMTMLLDEAATRFNLGPQDWQFLRRLFVDSDSVESEPN